MYCGYTLGRLLYDRYMKPAELAYAVGMCRSNVTQYTTGHRMMPVLDTAHAFCDALGISLDEFWAQCEADSRTEGYARWLRAADKRYKRGEFAEESGSGCRSGDAEMVAGEGVEPPTQGFSVSRRFREASCPRMRLLTLAA